jgi:hypothetical protein
MIHLNGDIVSECTYQDWYQLCDMFRAPDSMKLYFTMTDREKNVATILGTANQPR